MLLLTWYADLFRSFNLESLSEALDKYEQDIFARVEPSFLKSRQACLDAHDFSKIEGSPLVSARSLKKSALLNGNAI